MMKGVCTVALRVVALFCAVSLAACGNSDDKDDGTAEPGAGRGSAADAGQPGSGGAVSGDADSGGGGEPPVAGSGGVPTSDSGAGGSTEAGRASGGSTSAGSDAGGAPQAGAASGGTGGTSDGGASNAGASNAGASNAGASNAGASGESGGGGTGPACVEGEEQTQSCGLNGAGSSTRQCSDGAWSAWSSCADPDVCTNGNTNDASCGPNGRGSMQRSCVAGAWTTFGTCVDPDMCVDGARQEQACGLNARGSQNRMCTSGNWSSWSNCQDPDECVDGAVRDEACGLNGRGSIGHSCVAGAWDTFGACVDPDACVDGTADEQACGLNRRGGQSRMCTSGSWSSWSDCEDPDECVDGGARSEACGLNGRGRVGRSCVSGNWASSSDCEDPDACVDGAVRDEACGLNGRGSIGHSCVAGAWDTFGACVDPDTCVDGTADEQACGLNRRGGQSRTCTSGRWSSWLDCEDPDECVDGTPGVGGCGLNGRGQRSRTCENGAFGAWSTCNDPDECRDGATRNVVCGAGSDAHETETCVLGSWDRSHACSCDLSWQILTCDGTCVDTPDHLYVDDDNTGCADGTSWATALPKLTAALVGPHYLAPEIWVAEGVYYTGEQNEPSSKTFDLRGVALYGGFAGTETRLEERDPQRYTTVLSGDLNRSGSSDSGDSDSVVTVFQSSAVIDGFTITSGYAMDYGGGLDADDSYVRVQSCVFEDNQAGYSGGAIYVSGSVGIDVIDSTFAHNNLFQQFNTSAGAISVSGDEVSEAKQALTMIVNSVFYGNNDGPMVAEGEVVSVSYARATIVNSLFYGNFLRCTSAIEAWLYGTVRIYGTTIAGNHWLCNSCPSCASGASAHHDGRLYLTNVIARDDVAAHAATGGQLRATYTNHPTLLSGTGNTTLAPTFVDVASGDYCLSPGSAGINAGSSALLPADNIDLDDDDVVAEAIPFDLHGEARVSGPTVDQGACEFQQ